MKIAVITIYPKKGGIHSGRVSGVASYSKNLVSNMPWDKNDSVWVLAEKQGKRDEYKEDGVRVKRCYDRNIKFIFQLGRELWKIKPDAVHIQQELGLFGGILTAWMLQFLVLFSRIVAKRTVITLHGVADTRKIDAKFVRENNSSLPAPLVKLAFWLIYKPLTVWSNALIVHENMFKDILVSCYRVSCKKIFVIPHGIEDLRPIAQELARKSLGLSDKKEVVLFMGYLTGYKGIDHLIEGFAEYLKSSPNAFLIIGAGKHPKLYNDETYLKNEYGRLQTKAAELLPKENYTWQGFIGEEMIGAYYSAADVSVYPYTVALAASGPMSISIGYNRPFIASDAFGSVFDKKLIFANTKKGLSDKLKDFFSDQSSYDHLVSGMREERLWKGVARKTYGVYE